jgi:hypothetical protein
MKLDVQMKCYQRSVHSVGQHSGTAPKTDMATRARGDYRQSSCLLPSSPSGRGQIPVALAAFLAGCILSGARGDS